MTDSMVERISRFARPGEHAAYERGQKAHGAGKPLLENPYTHVTSIQSANHRAWRLGWSAAAGSAAAKRAMDAALEQRGQEG